MRQHRIAWTLALGALSCALAIAAVRQFRDGTEEAAFTAQVQDALARVAADPSLLQRETCAAVRAVAVTAERQGGKTAESSYVLALQYEQEHNLKGAEAYYRRAIALRPTWWRPYASLGSLLGRHSFGRAEEAERLLRVAIDLDPDAPSPHDSLAVLLRIQGDLAGAEQEARAALARDPDDLAANNNFANLLVELGRLDEAEQYYRTAIVLASDHPKPYYNLACVCAMQGRADEAIDYLREAVRRADILRREAAGDPDFERIRHDPRFRVLIWPEEDTPPGGAD